MMHRVPRELTKEEIQNIARTNHAWQGEHNAGQQREIRGFCKNPTLEEVRKHGQVRTPAGISVPKSATMIMSPLGRRWRGSGSNSKNSRQRQQELDAAIEAMPRMPGFSMQR